MGSTVIFLDEIDALATSRDDAGIHEASRRSLSVLLRKLDGFEVNRYNRYIRDNRYTRSACCSASLTASRATVTSVTTVTLALRAAPQAWRLRRQSTGTWRDTYRCTPYLSLAATHTCRYARRHTCCLTR